MELVRGRKICAIKIALPRASFSRCYATGKFWIDAESSMEKCTLQQKKFAKCGFFDREYGLAQDYRRDY
jgi:hypothetical protein